MAELSLARKRDEERDRLAKPGFNRELNFFYPVVAEATDEYIGYIDHFRRRDPGQPVTLNLNSPGGSVIEGFAFYDALQRLRRTGSHLTIRGTGAVMSMGTILLQAADNRILDRNALVMIHEVSGGAHGKVSEIMDTMVGIKKLQDRGLDILAERSTMSRDEIADKWKKTDWFLTAEEAVELGFADVVE